MYPTGGGCHYCGSVRHLSRDCKPTSQEEGVKVLGVAGGERVYRGDDDDVFGALSSMDQEREQGCKNVDTKSKVQRGAKVIKF